jgi:hypothetical protein
MMRTPKKQGWSDHYYQLDFRATSQHSVQTGGVLMQQTQMVTLYIRGVYLPGFELLPSMMMLGLAAAVIGARNREFEVDDEGMPVPFDPIF